MPDKVENQKDRKNQKANEKIGFSGEKSPKDEEEQRMNKYMVEKRETEAERKHLGSIQLAFQTVSDKGQLKERKVYLV